MLGDIIIKVMIYDTETTGLYPTKCAIHQLAGMIGYLNVTRGEFLIKQTFDIRIKPFQNALISDEALAISKLTRDDINGSRYHDEPEALRIFNKILESHIDRYNRSDKMFLCGYNINGFDNAFLRAMFNRNGDNYFGSWFWSSAIDLYPIATMKLLKVRHRMPDSKLSTVCRFLSIEVEDKELHDATYDVMLCMELFKKLIEVFTNAE